MDVKKGLLASTGAEHNRKLIHREVAIFKKLPQHPCANAGAQCGRASPIAPVLSRMNHSTGSGHNGPDGMEFCMQT